MLRKARIDAPGVLRHIIAGDWDFSGCGMPFGKQRTSDCIRKSL
jgi:hypothetical protein